MLTSPTLTLRKYEELTNDRRAPPLYTGDFGDCLAGPSALDLARFDLAYDAGNDTLVLHLEGVSSVKKESVMCK
jgi:hypothetical protein